MPPTPDRPFSRADVYVLLGSGIAGFAWAWLAWANLMHIFGWNLEFLAYYRGLRILLGDRYLTWAGVRMALRLVSDLLAPPTLAVVALGVRRPRQGFRQPGVLMAASASVVLVAEALAWQIQRWTLWDELNRLQASTYFNVVQYPRMTEGSTVAGLIGCVIGEHPGLAVLGVFLACRVSRLRGQGPDGLDRLGRALGLAWVLVALGFLAVPILPR